MARVFVLGAGASRGLNSNAPVMDGLSEEVFRLSRSRLNNSLLSRLQKFIDNFYPHLSKDGWIHLEHLLSLIDISILEDRPLSSKYGTKQLRSVRNSIVYAILLAIRENLTYDWNDPNGVRTFVELHLYISSFWAQMEKGDTVISLNYDLIADNFLLDALAHNEILPEPPKKFKNAKQRSPLPSVDYGFQPRFRFRPRQTTETRYIPDPRIQLIKLHGSLNWLYCPLCQAIDVTEGSKGTIVNIFEDPTRDLVKCQICGTPYEPVIITPTLLKQYRNPRLAELWGIAEERLRYADEVIFIGYSFPDADIVLKTMLTRVIHLNNEIRQKARIRTAVKIKVVDWIDPQKRDLTKPTSPYLNYTKNFGDIEYDWTGFREYIERDCQIMSVRFNP